MKYMAIIDADEEPVSCEFIGCNGNVTPYIIGSTTNIEPLEQTTNIKHLEQEPCEDCISRQKFTVGQIMDLIDCNRSGEGMTVRISERDDYYSTIQTDSILLRMIEDFEVDSISGDAEGIIIWLSDNSIADFVEKEKNKS